MVAVETNIMKDAYRSKPVVEVTIQPVEIAADGVVTMRELTPQEIADHPSTHYWRGHRQGFDDGVASEKGIEKEMTKRYLAAFVATLFITLLVANFAIQLHWI